MRDFGTCVDAPTNAFLVVSEISLIFEIFFVIKSLIDCDSSCSYIARKFVSFITDALLKACSCFLFMFPNRKSLFVAPKLFFAVSFVFTSSGLRY